jgi:hypothetical protein
MSRAEQFRQRREDLALKRYDLVFRHLAAKNGLFWTRSQIILVAHAALLGFMLKELASASPYTGWPELIVDLSVGVIGFILAVFWHYAVKSGWRWLEHWRSILRHLESQAYAEINVLRRAPLPKISPGSTDLARWTATLFIAVGTCVPVSVLCADPKTGILAPQPIAADGGFSPSLPRRNDAVRLSSLSQDMCSFLPIL